MSHETFETLAAGYAVGALDGEDLVQFEAHLAEGCARCETDLREWRETLARTAVAEPRAIPPPGVKDALLRRIEQTSPRVTDRGRWLRWAVGTAAVALAAAGFTGMYVAARYEAVLGRMARETAAVKQRVERSEAVLREQLALYRDGVALLRDPATRVVEMRGVGTAAGAAGRVLWNDKIGGQVFVASLPAAPPGKAYELWTISGRTPRAAGMLALDAAGQAAQPIAATPDGRVDVFAVTLEPEGGVPAPTGPIVLASK
jgi:anti-sigma-K factor RskA